MDVAIRSTSYVLGLQSKALLASISLAQLWLTISAKLVLTLLSLMGLLPNEYANRLKIQELNTHVDIMHQREAKLLERVETLTAEAESQSKDKSRAIRKLHKARLDSEAMAASLDDLRSTPSQQGANDSSQSRAGDSGFSDVALSHALLWSAVGSVFLSRASMAALEFKLLMTILIPVVMMFVMPGDAPRGGWRLVLTQCVSSGVLGFLLNHRLC